MRNASCCVFLGSLVATGCSALPSSSSSARLDEWRENHVTVYVGGRALDEGDYDPVDKQGVLAVEYAHERRDDPIGFEVGVAGSDDEDESGGLKVEGTTSEIYGGIRKTFGDGEVHPYLGGGVALIRSEVEVRSGGSHASDDDASGALYVHGGVGFDVTPTFLLGLDLRFLFGSDLELGGVDTDADYGQLAIFASFGF